MKFLLGYLLIPVIVLLLFVQSTPAIEWQDLATNKVEWDVGEVTTAPKTITYKLYMAEPTMKATPTFVKEVSVLTYTFTIPSVMGVYFIGVSTVLNYNDPDETVGESDINWSNIDESGDGTSTPVPFGWKLMFPPKNLIVVEP